MRSELGEGPFDSVEEAEQLSAGRLDLAHGPVLVRLADCPSATMPPDLWIGRGIANVGFRSTEPTDRRHANDRIGAQRPLPVSWQMSRYISDSSRLALAAETGFYPP